MPLVMPETMPSVLAVGGHLKNTVALSVGNKVFVSQHIGDMETPQAFAAFEGVIGDFLRMYEATPEAVVHDLHPDYPSTLWAEESVAEVPDSSPGTDWGSLLAGKPTLAVQHHHAHLASCLADNGIRGTALGVTWDGTGYGTDHSVWGGEFLRGDCGGFSRVARLRPFLLPGGKAAVKEPRRTALALLWELLGEEAFEQRLLPPLQAFEDSDLRLLRQMLRQELRSPPTSSVGRLFDGVAALAGLHQAVTFEGQAAMALEFVADANLQEAYPINLAPPAGERSLSLRAPEDEEGVLEVDWLPTLAALLEDSRHGFEASIIAARFHNALVEAVVEVAQAIGEPRVALTGGCFQNRILTERAATRLREAGFEVLVHRQVPPNDGGISLGQIAVAAEQLQRGS
jgi:hydrogenase maturation protein HypF